MRFTRYLPDQAPCIHNRGVPVDREEDLARQLSHGDHVVGLLQLQGLLVDAAALFREDRIRVLGALLLLHINIVAGPTGRLDGPATIRWGTRGTAEEGRLRRSCC